MAVIRKRRVRGRTVLPGEGQDGDVQISSSGATIRLTGKTAGMALAVLLAAIGIVHYSGIMDQKADAPRQTAVGAGQVDSVVAQPADNKAPVVINAMIEPSSPSASTALEVRYDVNDPEGDAVTCDIRWFVDAQVVLEGTNTTLQPGPYREGSTVYAEVVPADRYSSGTVFTTSPVTIPNTPTSVTAVTLSPARAYLGSIITATPAGMGLDGDPIQFQYQWRVNGSPVGAASSQNVFDTTGLRKRDSISVMVTYSTGQASAGPVISNTLILENRKPVITSVPQTGLQGSTYLYQVVAMDPDGDTLKYRLQKFPEGMTIDSSAGLIRWELPKGVMFTGRNEVKVAVMVDDGDGGTDSQEYSLVLTDVLVY
jgi:hypothetical protein